MTTMELIVCAVIILALITERYFLCLRFERERKDLNDRIMSCGSVDEYRIITGKDSAPKIINPMRNRKRDFNKRLTQRTMMQDLTEESEE